MRVYCSFLAALILLSCLSCRRGAQDYLRRGNKFLDSGSYEDAQIQFQKALQRDANLGAAYYGIGVAEMSRGRGADAYVPLSRAVQLMPENDAVKVKLADVSFALYVVAPQHPKTLYDQVEELANQILAKNANSFD